MHFITETNKEGHVAFTRGLAHSENPYHVGTEEYLGWDAGWIIAQMMGATQHPDDKFDVIDEKRTHEIAQDVLYTLIEEGKLLGDEKEATSLVGYWAWLDSIDPRIKTILVALDDENTSGHVGAREQYLGQLEVMLIMAAKDGNDFIKMYATVCKKDVNDFQFRSDGAKLWNIVQAYATNKFNELVKKRKDE